MRETPEQYTAREGGTLFAEDLSRFRYHTGATLRRLAPDEECPLLFRDVGPQAMARFLRGQLRRLAGPTAPILYLRSSAYQEPYVDYERIGRLVFLRPLRFRPWHSGVPHVFIASADHLVEPRCVGFVPGEVPLEEADRRLAEAPDVAALREILGRQAYEEAVQHSLARLEQLGSELAETERLAEPVRHQLQSGAPRAVDRLREWLAQRGITEHDLCAAWHHLPRERRLLLREQLQAGAESLRELRGHP